MKREYNFLNNIKEQTNCDIYFPDKISEESKPMVILIHGFRAFKDWGFFPYFANKLNEAGYISACIDFSLNTVIDKEKSIFDMEKFAINTVSQEILEINSFIEDIVSGKVLTKSENNLWNKQIYLIGHSLGGALAISVASKNDNIVKKLVTINSISDFDIYTEKQKEKWFNLGYKEFFDSNTNQTFRLNLTFLTDRLTYSGNKSVASMVSKLNIPYLILHSENDITVSLKASDILYNASNKQYTEKIILKHTNHTLGVKHPFTNSNKYLDNTINIIVDFFNKYTTL